MALQENLEKQAAQFVEGTPEGDKVLYKIYPEHIYDPQRRKMALELAGKEVAKIIDVSNDKQRDDLQKAVKELYEGRRGVYAPVHDFWSFTEMILHVKKKELPELITAGNVSWREEDLPLEKLHLTWMPFLEEHPAIFGSKPWPVSKVRAIFSQNKQIFDKALREQRETVGLNPHNFDQSDEPVTVLRRHKELELIDGNGRLYRLLLQGDSEISCYTGRLDGAMPKNYWVSASTLKQLCLEIRGYAETDQAAFLSALAYLRVKLANNATALINYVLYLRADFPEFEDGLQNILP